MELIILFIFGVATGSLTTQQLHYNKCMELGFKGEACAFEKSMCLKGKDKSKCE